MHQPQSLWGRLSLTVRLNLVLWVTFVLRKHQHHRTPWVKVSKSYLEHLRSPTNSLRRSGTDKLYVGQTYSQLRLVDWLMPPR